MKLAWMAEDGSCVTEEMRSVENQDAPEAPMTRIVIAEDHHIVRHALKRLLVEAGYAVVGEADDGAALEEAVAQTGPDLVLMDVAMPNHEPAKAVRKLRTLYPEMKVVVLSAYNSVRYVVEILEAGVDGYILKDDPPEVLVDAIPYVLGGRRWISKQVGATLAEFYRYRRESVADPLTEREREVLVEMARGHRNETIAERLVISENTLRNHISRIYQKLDATSRVEAVIYALSLQLISLDEVTPGTVHSAGEVEVPA